MNHFLDRDCIKVSSEVHRALNDLVDRMTCHEVSGWQGNYDIVLNIDGTVDARPTKRNIENNLLAKDFKEKLRGELVFLPTPEWVQTDQGGFICFRREIPVYMKNWWDEFAKYMG